MSPGSNMAIWQYKLTFVPEAALRGKFEILPASIPVEMAEDFPWWSDVQPSPELEERIGLMLPETASWCTSMRIWGNEESDDAHVIYADERKEMVTEIGFRLDARGMSSDLIRGVCALAAELRCVLVTREYEILLPDESMLMSALQDQPQGDSSRTQ